MSNISMGDPPVAFAATRYFNFLCVEFVSD